MYYDRQPHFLQGEAVPVLPPFPSPASSRPHLQVVLLSHFSEGGASQLYFDLSKALVPLLAQYMDVDCHNLLLRCVEENGTNNDELPPHYRSLEASRLLRQLPGSLELLSSYLKSALAGDEEAVTPATTALEDMGVYSLSLTEADSIVKRRVFI